ncbi:hypothetical protein V2J09_003653 [Rumex salicifolius]
MSTATSNSFAFLPHPRRPSPSVLFSPPHKPSQNPHLLPAFSTRRRNFSRCIAVSSASDDVISICITSDSGLQFHEKLLYLESLNVDPLKAIGRNPNFRSSPLAALKSVENCLSSMGILRSEFGRIFDMYPQLLTCDPHRDIYPIFEFLLNEVRIPFPDIRKSINRCPRLLVCSVDDQLRPTLYFLRKLGFTGRHRITSQKTLLLVSSVENTLLPKIEFLQDLGFSHSTVTNMLLRSPCLLTFSIENNYRPKVEYFLKEMKGDLTQIKRFPQYFSFSLEGKIKPRHRLLVEHSLSMPLSEMLKVSDGEFNVRLLEMRLQCLEQSGIDVITRYSRADDPTTTIHKQRR